MGNQETDNEDVATQDARIQNVRHGSRGGLGSLSLAHKD